MSGRAFRETIGFLGVIGSLVFVGLEIHQNTIAARANAIQESVNVAREQIQMYALDGNAARIRLRATQDGLEALGDLEELQYRAAASSALWGWQGLYSQWRLGVLDDDDWRGWSRVICRSVEVPAFRAEWARLRDLYIDGFVALVEACDGFGNS